MRGDLALELRLALRRRALPGVAAAVAAVLAIASVYLPWYDVVARISMLGATRATVVASLAGWEAQPWVWAAAGLGATAGVLGVLVAVDRPLRRTRERLVLLAIGLALVTIVSFLVPPPQERFEAAPRMRELRSAALSVPEDVTLAFDVRPAEGVWLSLLAAGVLLVAAFTLGDDR